MSYASGPIRKLSQEERMRWGECPVCEAEHGNPCHAAVGIQIGVHLDGSRMKDGEGVHVARLEKTPEWVRETPSVSPQEDLV